MKTLPDIARQSVVIALLLCSRATALDNGLGKVPQMGYNSWYDLMFSAAM
eukprot:SAG11_NODE_10710_length_810_cov_1.607595_1_plen_49_part_10